jgi:ketosteroid isomerase-like protein
VTAAHRSVSVRTTAWSFTRNDDGDARAFIRYGFTANATGKNVTSNILHYWRFRDGKVAFYRGSEDTALIADALGV